MGKMKNIITKEYRRLSLLLKSKLNSANMIKAINTWAVSLLRYPAEILNWTKEKMKVVDRKMRKLMTMNGMLHPRVCLGCTCQGMRGRGRVLASAEETIKTEVRRLSDNIKNTEKGYNRLLQSLEDKTKRAYKGDIKEQKEDWTEKPLHGQ